MLMLGSGYSCIAEEGPLSAQHMHHVGSPWLWIGGVQASLTEAPVE